MASFVATWFGLIKETAREFFADEVIKLSASLAYYTVFSIGPLLLVVISFTGLFFEQEAVTGKIYYQISSLIGPAGAQQVIDIIHNLQQQQSGTKFSIIGLIVLLVGATSVFSDIQDSINYIWSIKAKPKKGWIKYLRNRLLSFSLVVGIGFLLIVSLFVNTITDLITERLQRLISSEGVIFFQVINTIILFFVISCLFAVIYKVLPDADIRWKDSFVGAFFTGVLFICGKYLITLYLNNADIDTTYGAAASIIIVLVWVYYTSVILFIGAEFTKVYALRRGGGIEPYDTAVFIIKQEAKELPASSGTHS
jgi:membrane protein